MEGKDIREILDRLKMTQEEFAEALSVSQPAISAWLKGGTIRPAMAIHVRRTADELARKKAS